MKSRRLLLMVALVAYVLVPAVSIAATNPAFTRKADQSTAQTRTGKKLAKVTKDGVGTVHSFDDQVVGGKYQYPDEAVATVEDEKVLNDLLAVRKDFKDRLTQSSARH